MLYVVILLVLATVQAHADLFTVPRNNTNRLINIIEQANRTSEHDTIHLSPGDYELTRVHNSTAGPNGLPSITSPITIYGNGAQLIRALQSEPYFRFFYVAPSGSLTLDNLTLEGGALDWEARGGGGSAILNHGFLNLSGTTLRHNGTDADYNTAIVNTGTLVMTQSVIEGSKTVDFCGGALLNDHGTATITRSIIRNNYADTNSGGLCNQGGAVWLVHSTISGNRTDGPGAGILNWESGRMYIEGSTISGNVSSEYPGAGIHNNGEMTVINSTVSGNIAGANGSGGIDNWGQLRLLNVTITENRSSSGADDPEGIGAGLGSRPTATTIIEQSIIAGNKGFAGYFDDTLAPFDCSGNISSQGYNLTGVGCPHNGPGDQSINDPMLAPLADNGGPTSTHLPLADNPSIDAVPQENCRLSRDQRGERRPLFEDGRCDIGAVEVQLSELPSCTDLFGNAPEFLLCGETTSTCSFNAFTNGKTCDTICENLGSTCVGAMDNDGNSCNVLDEINDTCQTRRQTEICICKR